MSERLGTVIGGRYKILSLVGQGGMGTVYRAEHVLMHKQFAIKLVHAELSASSEVVGRFEREAVWVSRLEHPHIIQVTDFGREEDGTLFLVMELLSGSALTELISKEKHLSVARSCRLMVQILAALEHAHRLGVVHRDLKPDNLIVGSHPTLGEAVTLLDFGIAKLVAGEAPALPLAMPALTRAGVIFGTPAYMAPEQIAGEEIDARADLYAAGVVLFEMLTGRLPFEGTSASEFFAMHLSQAPPRLSTTLPDGEFSAELENLVARALAKSKYDRFENADAFAAALQTSLRGTAETFAHSNPVPLSEEPAASMRTSRPGWRTPRFIWALTGACVALGGILVVSERSSTPGNPSFRRMRNRTDHASIEASIAKGDIVAARGKVQLELSKHPSDARLYYHLANLAILEGRHKAALAAYEHMLKLDAQMAKDGAVLQALRDMLEKAEVADQALDLLIDHSGKDAVDILAGVAEKHRSEKLRSRAFAALEAMGQEGRVDGVLYYGGILRSNRPCQDRKLVLAKLLALDDARSIPILKKERQRRTGFLRRGKPNACMEKQLEEALGKPPGK